MVQSFYFSLFIWMLRALPNIQWSAYLIAKYEAYIEEHNGMPPFQVAAKYLRLRNIEDEDRVWVLNKTLQLN